MPVESEKDKLIWHHWFAFEAKVVSLELRDIMATGNYPTVITFSPTRIVDSVFEGMSYIEINFTDIRYVNELIIGGGPLIYTPQHRIGNGDFVIDGKRFAIAASLKQTSTNHVKINSLDDLKNLNDLENANFLRFKLYYK